MTLIAPCRLLFDASQPATSGFSLNDILSKGRNDMNEPVDVVIQWFTNRNTFYTDISKHTILFYQGKKAGIYKDTNGKLNWIPQKFQSKELSKNWYRVSSQVGIKLSLI